MNKILVVLLGCCWSLIGLANPLTLDEVPPPLQPWTNWALWGATEQACPLVQNGQANSSRLCAWPSYLHVTASATQARFSQKWQLYRTEWIPLPGQSQVINGHWPEKVQVNQVDVLVIEREGLPWVRLEAGRHEVTGEFFWERMPEFLRVPSTTGLVTLSVMGQDMVSPEWDRQGRLWLNRSERARETTDEDRLSLRVYRRISDQVPLQSFSRLVLDVAGRHREVVLAPVLLADQIPMQLISTLPARLEPSGELRLQVRPGTWQVDVLARSPHDVTELYSMALHRDAAKVNTSDIWAAEELWSFEAQPMLRVVEIGGVTAVDPQQTQLPNEWRTLPTYRVLPNETMTFSVKQRGLVETTPNQLHLYRQYWLDFDGGGYSIQDRITGQMNSHWRLNMLNSEENQASSYSMQLGRVSIAGQDQFITRLAEDQAMGVEIRQNQVDMVADSRLYGDIQVLPVVGWAHDAAEFQQFQQVNASLHLPPGWSLLHLYGADQVTQTWLQNWTLLDLFIVLILSLAVAKLWGYIWGMLILVTLVVSYQQHPTLPWVWMQVIAALALLRVLPGEGKLQWWVKGYRNLSLLVLLVLVIPFLVDQMRTALYPQLSQSWRNLAEEQYYYDSDSFHHFNQQNQAIAPPPPSVALSEPVMEYEEKFSRSRSNIEGKTKKSDSSPSLSLLQIDPNVYVQTGQGLPRWQWQKIDLTWSGPVSHEEMMQLWLLPPEWTRVLNVVRAGLVGILAAFFLYLAWAKSARSWFYQAKSTSTAAPVNSTAVISVLAVCLGAILASGSMSSRAESTSANHAYPAPELLSELRQRLLALPDCMPHCVSSPRVHLQLEGNVLTLRQQVHSQVSAAIPLPGQDRHWLAQQVWLNGEPATALQRDDQGQLWLSVARGIHEIQLIGIVPARNSWQLPFLLKPKRLTLSVEGWQVEGLRDSGEVEGTLQFTRQLSGDQVMPLEMGTLPPFVQVERVLSLGLDWQVQTTVTRLSPLEGAVVLEIPLLPGESVTSEYGRVVQGHLQLTLPAHQKTMTWSSVLQPQPNLTLTATTSLAMVEVWRLNVSAIWHLVLSGIPQVQQQSAGYWSPVWRPFPGEQVMLQLSRPLGVSGQLLTIDHSVLEVTPGQRSTDYKLTLSIRSGRGTRHPVILPEGAELQNVFINNMLQPIQAQNGQVVLPISPGEQQVVLHFREARGAEMWFTTSQVDLGVESVNHRVELSPPSQRWILLTWGDAVGPAVLIWGLLLVMLFVSFGLGQLPLTPLKTRHWLLLTVVLTPLSVELVLVVVGWLLALGWRRELKIPPLTWRFNLLQLALTLWTVVALWTLLLAIEQGLLGHPDMHIAGNGSSAGYLRWYQDRVDGLLPSVGMLSLSMWWYRILMLLWALWLSFALLRWLPWAWGCLTIQGLSRPFWERKGKTVVSE